MSVIKATRINFLKSISVDSDYVLLTMTSPPAVTEIGTNMEVKHAHILFALRDRNLGKSITLRNIYNAP